MPALAMRERALAGLGRSQCLGTFVVPSVVTITMLAFLFLLPGTGKQPPSSVNSR